MGLTTIEPPLDGDKKMFCKSECLWYNTCMKKVQIIDKASDFAAKVHAGQTRRGGEPYYNHVHRVAGLVRELTEDADMIEAAYLHDTMEDCGITADELALEFGANIASLVQELTNDEVQLKELGKEEYMVRKLTTISANALLIKLCDTLNNMTETDRPSQAGTYARIQQRLQQIPPAGWSDTHQALSNRILAIYADKFGTGWQNTPQSLE